MTRKRTSRTKVFNVCFREASKHAKKGHAAFDRALHTCLVRKAGGKAYGGVKRGKGQSPSIDPNEYAAYRSYLIKKNSMTGRYQIEKDGYYIGSESSMAKAKSTVDLLVG